MTPNHVPIGPWRRASRRILAGAVMALCGQAVLGQASPDQAGDATPGGLVAPTLMAPALVAPTLGAVSNFGQGFVPARLEQALALGVRDFRDGISWQRSETAPGRYDFSDPRASYPALIAAAGADLSLTLNWGHALYDGGDTPTSAAAVSAFGAFAAELVRRFPDLDAIEVGNEFNGVDFVRGPLETASIAERAAAHVALLGAAAAASDAVAPEVRILGGAAHSIPGGWFGTVMGSGGAQLAAEGLLDAIVVHPYTTPPEQIVRQVEVIRDIPLLEAMPIEVTEFGSDDAGLAAGLLLRNHCQMGLAGVSRAVWYPLTDRGDGMVPLIDQVGRATEVGLAYRMAAAEFAGRPIEAWRPDPFTYGCVMGGDTLVAWGEPRTLRPGPGVRVRDAAGRALDARGLALSMDRPLVLRAAPGSDVLAGLRLGPQRVVADSYHQFGYPGADTSGDPFRRAERLSGRTTPLVARPGQEREGVPWTPYLAGSEPPLRVTAQSLVPGGGPGRPIEVVHAIVMPVSATVDLELLLGTPDRSEDGVSVTVTLNGRTLHAAAGRGALDVVLDGLALRRGDLVEVAVGPNGTAAGDVAAFRLTLRRS